MWSLLWWGALFRWHGMPGLATAGSAQQNLTEECSAEFSSRAGPPEGALCRGILREKKDSFGIARGSESSKEKKGGDYFVSRSRTWARRGSVRPGPGKTALAYSPVTNASNTCAVCHRREG